MKNIKMLVSLLMVLLMGLSLCSAAFAENPFKDEQYYDADESQFEVFTVQVCTTSNYDGAVALRTQMLNAGYDAFIYQSEGLYLVMCGKFKDYYYAGVYAESIHEHTDRWDAYVTTAKLPDEAVQEFAKAYYGSTMEDKAWGDRENGWEEATGLFFKADAPDTVPVYTVCFSNGSSFLGTERNRDAMNAQGYTAFVYKEDLFYRVMTGAFATEEEAEAYRKEIKANTDRPNPYVTTANLPASALENGLTKNTGLTEICGNSYFFEEDGTVAVNTWKELDGSTFYFGGDGAMLKSVSRTIDGASYTFDENGVSTKA